ncbi:MAG: glycosyltransferase family 4 protein [Bryobacteraceae bacterium]|nr:glycosyltransferase family 4 protein [Bryobacteraceae bacterium]
MRILLHDFVCHPFQLELSRELARQGHTLLHVSFLDMQGPKGDWERRPGDAPTYRGVGIELGGPFPKYSMAKRLLAHRAYLRRLRDEAAGFEPDVVLSGNTPIDVQHGIWKFARSRGYAFVHWMQDFYSLALHRLLERKWGRLASLASGPFLAMEREICAECDGVIFIAQDFERRIARHGMAATRSWVIENWASLNDLRPLPKANSWSERHGLDRRTTILYCGTLGLKHNPELLFHLAEAAPPEVTVAVVSEGLGRGFLEDRQRSRPALALRLFDFQPYAELPQVLATGDVLLSILEPDASEFAVPSKVLGYLSAGRPVILAAPRDNLVARVVEESGSGTVVDPSDTEGFAKAALELASDPERRFAMGKRAREYAEKNFEIGRIAAKFLEVLNCAVDRRRPRAAAASG